MIKVSLKQRKRIITLRFFKVLIFDELSNKKNSMTDLTLDKEYHDALLALHHNVTVEFAKKQKEMKERIRKFEEEQMKEFNAQQARAHLDRQKLWNSICVINRDSLVNRKRTQSTPQAVSAGEDPLSQPSRSRPQDSIPISSSSMSRKPPRNDRGQGFNENRQPEQDPKIPPRSLPVNLKSAPREPFSTRQPENSEKKQKEKESKANGHPKSRSRPKEQDTLFVLDGIEDENKNEEEDEEEVEEEIESEPEVETTEEIPEEDPDKLYPGLRNIYGTSVPLAIPPRFEDGNKQSDDDVPTEKEEVPFEAPHIFIAKSYAANPDDIFGERPRRMNFSYGL